jgi:hypothetical protein
MLSAHRASHLRKVCMQAATSAGFGRAPRSEEPVSSDDLAGLRLLRDRAPAGMEVAAGEYAYHLIDFRRLVEADAVDGLQADATRWGGFTLRPVDGALHPDRSGPGMGLT